MPSHITSFRFSRTVVVALAAGLLLYGCSFEDTGQKTATADATVAEPVTSVDVKDARRGSIEVTPGTGPGVTIHRRPPGLREAPDVGDGENPRGPSDAARPPGAAAVGIRVRRRRTGVGEHWGAHMH